MITTGRSTKVAKSAKERSLRTGSKMHQKAVVFFSYGQATSAPSAFNFMSPLLMPSLSSDSARSSPSEKISGKHKNRKMWTSQEDESLCTIMTELGESVDPKEIKWKEVAVHMGTGRVAKQCRDRWYNHLRPGIKKGKWSAEEEALLKDMYHTFGPKWSAMAKLFKNRTDNDIKNKWYSMVRKEKRIEDKFRDELGIDGIVAGDSGRFQGKPSNLPGFQFSFAPNHRRQATPHASKEEQGDQLVDV